MRSRIETLVRRFKYRFAMWRAGVSEQYIRKAFCGLAEMDIGMPFGSGGGPNQFYNDGNEWLDIPDSEISFAACGNTVQIKDGTQHWTISENKHGEVYVFELRDQTRKFRMEMGLEAATKWWEVYRSGSFIHSTKFVEYLKLLYGDGKFGMRDAKVIYDHDSRSDGTEIHEGG